MGLLCCNALLALPMRAIASSHSLLMAFQLQLTVRFSQSLGHLKSKGLAFGVPCVTRRPLFTSSPISLCQQQLAGGRGSRCIGTSVPRMTSKNDVDAAKNSENIDAAGRHPGWWTLPPIVGAPLKHHTDRYGRYVSRIYAQVWDAAQIRWLRFDEIFLIAPPLHQNLAPALTIFSPVT